MLRRASRALVYRVPGEQDRCPACGATQIFDLDVLPLRRPVGGYRTGFVSGCEDCGLVFRNPVSTPEDLKRFYSPEGGWGAPGAAPLERSEARSRSWSRAFQPIRSQLSVTKPPPGARVLDFGCGRGRLLDSFQEFGWETWGIDTAVGEAFSRHRRLDDIPDVPMFDLVVASHVLEHVTDPLGLLRQLSRACRVGGFLFVGTPRLDTLPVHRDYNYVINGRAHVSAFTWPCLQGLLARAGWSPVAPPPDRISKGGGGRHTYARLRVLAQRVEIGVEPLQFPADSARTAIRQYQAALERPLFERLQMFRLAARQAERHRTRAIRDRKSNKHVGSLES